MEYAALGFLARPDFIEKHSVEQDFFGWTRFSEEWGDPPTRRVIAEGGGGDFFPITSPEETELSEILVESLGNMPEWQEHLRQGHFFVSADIEGRPLFGRRALMLAALMKPNARQTENSPTVERRSRSIHFHFPNNALVSIVENRFGSNTAVEIVEAMMIMLEMQPEYTLLPNKEDELENAFLKLVRRPKGDAATAIAYRTMDRGWHPPSHLRVWTAVASCHAAAHSIAMHSREPAQLRVLGKMMRESLVRACAGSSPYPSDAFEEIDVLFKEAQSYVQDEEAFKEVIRWQEIVDLKKVPMEKGMMMDPESIRASNAMDFARPLDPEVEANRKELLERLGYGSFKGFARDCIAIMFVPETAGEEEPFESLAKQPIGRRYRYGDIPLTGYRPSPSATPSVGQRDGGQIRFEMEVLKSRIANGEEGYHMNVILEGPESYLAKARQMGFDQDWLREQREDMERMLTQSSRDAHRAELDHAGDCHEGCTHIGGHPTKVSQTIWDETNQNFRGLVNQEMGNLYGGVPDYIERMLKKHLVCYKKKPTGREIGTLTSMQNAQDCTGMNKVLLVPEDATKATSLADGDCIEACADVLERCFHEQIDRDTIQAIRRNNLSARLVRLPERHELPTLSLQDASFRPALVEPPLFLWSGDLMIQYHLESPFEDITNGVLAALEKTTQGPSGLKAGTGSGKTLTTILALANYCAETGRKADFIMDTQASVNNMCLSSTGRIPQLGYVYDNGSDGLWEFDSPLAQFAYYLADFGVHLDESIVGFTHGNILSSEERSGLLTVTSRGSWLRRQGNDPSDLIVVDEADAEKQAVDLTLGEASRRSLNLMFISATLSEIPYVGPGQIVEALPPRPVRSRRIGSSGECLVQYCRRLTNRHRQGGICLVIGNSIRLCQEAGRQLEREGLKVGYFDGQMDAEEGQNALEPPYEGIRFVCATSAVKRADLKRVGLVIIPNTINRSVEDSRQVRGVAQVDVTKDDLAQFGGRAARGGFPLFEMANETPVHIVVRGEPTNQMWPEIMEGSPYSHGLLMGSNGYPAEVTSFPMTDGQSALYAAGHFLGTKYFEENSEDRDRLSLLVPKVREWLPSRVLPIRGMSRTTQMAAIILGEGMHLSLSTAVAVREERFPGESEAMLASLRNWYMELEQVEAMLMIGQLDHLGMSWRLLREYLEKSTIEGPVNWSGVCDACPEYYCGLNGAMMNGTINQDTANFGSLLIQSATSHRGSNFDRVFLGEPPFQVHTTLSTVRSYGAVHLQGGKVTFHPASERGPADWANKVKEWQDKLLNAAHLHLEETVGWQTRGWSLADLFSVLLLAIIKEIQGFAFRAIMKSSKCYDYLVNQRPTGPQHFVGGVQMKFGVEAIQGAFDVVRFTMNKAKTGYCAILNAECPKTAPPERGCGNSISGGDDGLSLAQYYEDENQLPSDLRSRRFFSEGIGLANFMQILGKITCSWNHGRPKVKHYHTTHLKTRSTAIALLRLNPGVQISAKKEPFLKTVADFLNVGEDERYKEELLSFLGPFLVDYVYELQMTYNVNVAPLWVALGIRKDLFPLHKALAEERNPHWEDIIAFARPQVEKKGAGTVEHFCRIAIEEEREDLLLECGRKVWEDFQRFWESHGALFFGMPRRGVIHYMSNQEIRQRIINRSLPIEGRRRHRVPDWFVAIYEVSHRGEVINPVEEEPWEERSRNSLRILET
jgi:hypothetical protein